MNYKREYNPFTDLLPRDRFKKEEKKPPKEEGAPLKTHKEHIRELNKRMFSKPPKVNSGKKHVATLKFPEQEHGPIARANEWMADTSRKHEQVCRTCKNTFSNPHTVLFCSKECERWTPEAMNEIYDKNFRLWQKIVRTGRGL